MQGAAMLGFKLISRSIDQVLTPHPSPLTHPPSPLTSHSSPSLNPCWHPLFLWLSAHSLPLAHPANCLKGLSDH